MIFGVAIAFLFLFEGLRRIIHFIFWIFEWKRSQDWLETPGKIMQSTLISTLVPRGGRKSRNIDGSVRLVTAYIPDIAYEYRANVETFESRKIFIGQQFPSNFNIANEFVEKYPIGKQVEVFYNPEKPQVSTLERNRVKELLWSFLSGVINILIGFAFLFQVVHD